MDIRNLLQNLERKDTKKPVKKTPKVKNAVRGYKPADNRQVTHNLRRRMGR